MSTNAPEKIDEKAVTELIAALAQIIANKIVRLNRDDLPGGCNVHFSSNDRAGAVVTTKIHVAFDFPRKAHGI